MAASSLLLLVSVLLCVHQTISTSCPPTSGIYLMYNGDCYPNGSFFRDVAITITPLELFPNSDYLQCILPNVELIRGEWSRTAGEGEATGTVNCDSSTDTDPLRCVKTTSPAQLSLYRPIGRDFNLDDDQLYKCCLPTLCSDPFASVITAYIFRRIQIVEFKAELSSNKTEIAQNLILHCITTGSGTYSVLMHFNSINEITNSYCPSCTRQLIHSFNTTYDNTVTLTWDTKTISNDDMSFSQLANGDQMYTCNVTDDSVSRSLNLTVLVPEFIPSSVTIVSKTATTITVNWTSNPTDADGYVVNATSDTAGTVTQQVEGGDVNITTLRGLKGGTPYNITIRAYQDLLGPTSNVTTVQTYYPAIDWTLVSSISDLQYTQYRIDCLTDINNTYWIVNGIYTDVFTNDTIEKGGIYNNSFIINSNPLGMSINVTCVLTYTKDNYYHNSVILQAPSGPPLDIKGYILNETSIKVNWTMSSHANGYVIVFTDLMNKVVSSVTETQFITNTLPLSTYNISVYSYIDVPSVESVPISFTFNVPSPITNLTVTGVSTNTITVNWISPNGDEGNYVTHYNISYTPSCPDLPSLNVIVHVPPYTTMSSYTLMELYSGMNYTITVRAGNVLGESDPMNINYGTLPNEVPRSSPNSVSITYINQTSINITWDDINCINSNGRILEYIVMISNDTISYNITSTERYIIVNDLPIGIYKISVGGVNSIGSGPFSERIDVKIEIIYSSSISTFISDTMSLDRTSETTDLNSISTTISESLIVDSSIYSTTSSTLFMPSMTTEYQTSFTTALESNMATIIVIESTVDIFPTTAIESNVITDIISSLPTPTSTETIQMSFVDSFTSTAITEIQTTSIDLFLTTTTTTQSDDQTSFINSTTTTTTTTTTTATTTTSTTTTTTTTTSTTTTTTTSTTTSTTTTITTESPSVTIGNVIPDEPSNVFIYVGAGVACVIVFLLILLILIVLVVMLVRFKKRRRRFVTLIDEQNSPAHSSDGSFILIESSFSEVNMTSTEEVQYGTLKRPLISNDEPDYAGEKSNIIFQDDMIDGDDDIDYATLSSYNPTIPSTLPISINDLGTHVAKCHSNANAEFTTQFEKLYDGKDKPCTIGFSEENKLLNRFKNITVYDDNRIILKPMNECNSDYINACYIHGYKSDNKFIASQGPLTRTLVDFWRLVWQEKPQTIVMVTNLNEGKTVKCEQYWPDSEKAFGPFIVTLLDEQVLSDFVIRRLIVKLEDGVHNVIQYHFTSWPDYGVPEYFTPLMTLHKQVMRNWLPFNGPILVHCSAGVGRTGTFVAIDIALEQAKKEGIVDIAGIVNGLREQRMKMVQALGQYMFIHDTVLEVVVCGETVIPSDIYQDRLLKLKQIDIQTHHTEYESQFHLLSQVSPDPAEFETSCISAKNNGTKNRSDKYLPPEKFLVSIHKSYINASFLNGYNEKKAFIVAQSPMDNTVRDFWKMIVDYKVSAIVMLCDLVENGKESCYPYWKNGQVLKFDEYLIELIDESKENGYFERVLKISSETEGYLRIVVQFHITDWPVDGVVREPSTVLEVISGVIRRQQQIGGGPIVVHCSDTVSRTGVYCAVSIALEQCKIEGVVDVFQVTKVLKRNKPGAVTTLEQYISIHEVIGQYLTMNSLYENFT